MWAKFGCGPTVVSKKKGGGVQTDRQADRQTKISAALYSRYAIVHINILFHHFCHIPGIHIRARPSGNGGTLLLYFALVLLIYPMLSKITTGTI